MTGRDRSAVRRALLRPGFRRLFAAQTVSRWGDTFNSVALVILVYQLTGSGLSVAGTVAFEIIPVVLLGFVAGAIVDRHPRRTVMLAADLGRAGVALSLVTVHDRVVVVYAAAFLLSAFSVFFNPAAASVLPTLVPEDEIVGANSAVWSAAVISQIALAPAAGAVVALAGAGPAFAVNAASFLISAALIARLPVPARPPLAPAKHVNDIVEGLRAIRSSRFLTVLAGVQGLAALSAGATSALLVVLAEEHLHVGPGRFGFLIGAIGIGAGFGPIVLQRLVTDLRRPAFLDGPYLLRGTVDIVLALDHQLPRRSRRPRRLRRRHQHRQHHLRLGAADHRPRPPTRTGLRLLRRDLAGRPAGQHRRRRRTGRRLRHHRGLLGRGRPPSRRRRTRGHPRSGLADG